MTTPKTNQIQIRSQIRRDFFERKRGTHTPNIPKTYRKDFGTGN